MTASLSSAPPLFSNHGAYDRPPLSKNNRIHCVKALLRREEPHAYLKRTPKMIFRLSCHSLLG